MPRPLLNPHCRAHTASMVRNYMSVPQCRAFSTAIARPLNPLLNLSGLSGSKEAQYFSKERKIPREEYSANYQLIRSSEVDPFAPAPGTSQTVMAALKRAQRGESDMQTAYSLAISNLLAQLEASRTEARATTQTLWELQEKYKKQEKHALVMMLGVVTLVAITVLQLDAFDTLTKQIERVRQGYHDFDWQWLSNPPTFEAKPSTDGSSTKNTTPEAVVSYMIPEREPNVTMWPSNVKLVSDVSTTNPGPALWTRHFWATPPSS